jgi:uncharacterized DUF497 family protein
MAGERAEKEGVSPRKAKELFTSGVDFLELYDGAHSELEERFVAIGPIHRGLVLVVHMERSEDTVRIIRARWAAKKERALYLGGRAERPQARSQPSRPRLVRRAIADGQQSLCRDCACQSRGVMREARQSSGWVRETGQGDQPTRRTDGRRAEQRPLASRQGCYSRTTRRALKVSSKEAVPCAPFA